MVDFKKWLCRICVILISIVLLLPLAYTLIASLWQTTPGVGIFSIRFVAFENIGKMAEKSFFGACLSNTLLIGICSVIFGAIYVFVSSLAIGSVKTNPAKGITAFLFAVPAFVPVNLLAKLFSVQLLMKPVVLLQIIAGAQKGLRLAALVLLATLFIKRNLLDESAGITGIYVVISLCRLFSSELTFITDMYNPLTYKVLDTFSTFIYRNAVVAGDYSFGAAVYVVKAVLQAVFAVAAYFLLEKIMDKEISAEKEQSCMPALTLAVFPVFILLMIIIKGSSCLPTGSGEAAFAGYMVGIKLAVASAFLVSLVSILTSAAARNCGKMGRIALIAAASAGDNIIGEVRLLSNVEASSPYTGIILQSLSMVPVLSLIFLYTAKYERSYLKESALFAVGFTLMFGWLWGDSFMPTVLLQNIDLWPISAIVRESIIYSEGQEAMLSTLAYILIPTWVSAVGLAITAVLCKGKALPQEVPEI